MSLLIEGPKPARLRRVEFTYRGRKFVAIRYRGGRVELYQTVDGIETFLRYARKSAGTVDRIAIGHVEDRLDPAAIQARSKLVHDPKATMGAAWGHWGAVEYTEHSTTGKPWRARASIRLYNEIGEARPSDYKTKKKRGLL